MNFQNKKILITGASKGLGYVCSKTLADNCAGLVLMARSKDQLEELRQTFSNPENHLTIATDFLDKEELINNIKKAKDFLKNIDVILHIAGGGLGLRDPLLSSDDFEKLFLLNLKSVIEINHLIVPDMIERKSGNVVHIGSIASNEAVASVGYNTSKAALAAYVRSLGREIANTGVVVTGILPGGFHAPGNAMDRLKFNKPEVYHQFIKERIPRGFMGQAEELIPLILFLCSKEASMMGGCMVPIDGGEGVSYTF